MKNLKFLNSISEVSESQWNNLWPSSYPFTQYSFLKNLEHSAVVNFLKHSPEKRIHLEPEATPKTTPETTPETTSDTGWHVQHATLWDGQELIAAMPLYLKTHSYGEYVFDWAWADAYHQNQLNYYPKLINAIPFTPATGPRIAARNKNDATQLQTAIIDYISRSNISSLHCLFPNKESQALQSTQLNIRYGTQFHWINQGYISFEDFLNNLSSRKRKNIVKERKKSQGANIDITMRNAHDIEENEWHAFYALYQMTYMKRSGHTGYLNLDFFLGIAKYMPDQVLLASAYHDGEMIAAALYFRDDDTLYGRYWGALAEYDGLHFECCYYQGIEYAITQKLNRFDPGAQGEHKIQRGFTPINTCSFHYIKHPQFCEAIKNFLSDEKPHINAYTQSCREHLPFKNDHPVLLTDYLLLNDYTDTPSQEENK